MKKKILALGIFVVIASCDTKTTNSSLSTVSELKGNTEVAAYGYGLNLGSQVEGIKSNPVFSEDSLDYEVFLQGALDFLNDDSNKKLSYLYGQSIGQTIQGTIKDQELGEDFNKEIVLQAIMSKLNKDSLIIPVDSARTAYNNFRKEKQDLKKTKALEKSNEYLAKTEKESGIKKTESGLLYEVLKEGEGAKPKDEERIKATYEGKLIDGTVFDSTEKNGGKPLELEVNRFVPGFTEGLKLMSPGAKFRFHIPPALAYGERGQPRGKIGPNEALIFEVELLEINPASASAENIAPQPSGK